MTDATPSAEKDARRDDSQSLREFVASIPVTTAWIEAQEMCPGCGGPLEEGRVGWRCFRSVSSVWCSVKRRHQTPPTTPIPPGDSRVG